jgi:hypothetical protein
MRPLCAAFISLYGFRCSLRAGAIFSGVCSMMLMIDKVEPKGTNNKTDVTEVGELALHRYGTCEMRPNHVKRRAVLKHCWVLTKLELRKRRIIGR